MNRYTLAGLGAILCWSVTVAFARRLSETLGIFTSASAVYLIGGVLCLIWARAAKGNVREVLRLPRRYLLVCGLLFCLYMISIYYAIGIAQNRLQVLEIGLVNYLWPMFTLIFSLPLLHKRFHPVFVPATLCALAGVFLVMTQGEAVSWYAATARVTNNPRAYGLALVAAVAWGLYSNLTRRWAGEQRAGAVEFFMLATGALFLVLRFFRPEETAWSLSVVPDLALLSVAAGAGYVLWDIGMRRGEVTLVASASYFTPFFSTVMSCFFLGVVPGPKLWLGCLLIVLGSFLSWISVSGQRDKTAHG
jgi:drug/metabolite transporter (DMT)-like permease